MKYLYFVTILILLFSVFVNANDNVDNIGSLSNNNEIEIGSNGLEPSHQKKISQMHVDCELIDDCKKCTEEEVKEHLCKASTYRKVFQCPSTISTNNIDKSKANEEFFAEPRKYVSCTYDSTPRNILYFEIGVVMLFIISVYFVRERKRTMIIKQNEKITKQISKV